MELLSFRSFSTEILKKAADVNIQDPAIRALKALRKGEEYLAGGQLPANAQAETGFMPKMAASILVPVDVYDLKARSKTEGPYQKIRDYATTGLRGALVGGSATKLFEKIRGAWHPKGVAPDISAKGYLGAAAVGAGLSLADKAYRRHQAKKNGLLKKAMLNPANFSPARALQRDQQVRHFLTKVHLGYKPTPPPGLVRGGWLPKP